MQIAGGLVAEFECDSNAVACPRLHPGRASTRDRTARRRISASAREKYSNLSCAEIRIRIDVSSDTCLHIGNRYTVRNKLDGKYVARVDGKKIFKFFDRATRDDAFIIRYLSEWFIYIVWWMRELLVWEMRKTLYIIRLFFTFILYDLLFFLIK